MVKKTNFNMQLTETQREIMDFVTDVIYAQYEHSKAEMVNMFFKNACFGYLPFLQSEDCEHFNISDEELLSYLKQEKKEKDMTMIRMVGTAKFRVWIEDCKVKYPEIDNSYNEQLLAEFIAKEGEQNNE